MFPFFGLLAGVDRTLALTANTVLDSDISPGTQTAEARLNSDGNYEDRGGGFGGWTTHAINQWIHDDYVGDPGFDASLYEGGYFSVTGSTTYLVGATLDTYHALSSTRTWSLSRFYSGFGNDSVTGTLKVREIAQPANEVTATLTLQIQAEL